MSKSPKPLPDANDQRIAPHLRAARAGRLSLQHCDACGYLRWPPGLHCPECLVEGGEWVDVPPEGTVWSLAVYHHAYASSFADDIPYQVALIELTSGPLMIGKLTVPTGAVVPVGTPVEAVFEPVTEDVTLVTFRPSTESA